MNFLVLTNDSEVYYQLKVFPPCSVFVGTHPIVNTIGVNHIPCLLHKVPFQFISFEISSFVYVFTTLGYALKRVILTQI
jgi:hypothetical protein